MKLVLAAALAVLPTLSNALSLTISPNVITEKDMYCLTQNIYFEARNQSLRGQYAVAKVTLNRMIDKRFPNTVCGVVWQKKQFSWTHDGKSDRPGKTYLEQKAWAKAQKVASKAFEQWSIGNDGTKGAVFYHADYVKPYWRKSFTKTVKIQDHIFYK